MNDLSNSLTIDDFNDLQGQCSKCKRLSYEYSVLENTATTNGTLYNSAIVGLIVVYLKRVDPSRPFAIARTFNSLASCKRTHE